MSSKRETILAAVATALAATAGAGGRVYRSLPQALADEEGASVVIRWANDEAEQGVVEHLDRTLTVTVAVLARESGGDTADEVADPVMVSAYALLMADTTLGGLAMDIHPGAGGFQNVDGNNNPGVLTQDFRILYRHTFGAMDA